jgi:uncharacterized coiled-coil protein SlyX
MEKRITTLEVRMNQTASSIDRLDRSITELRSDMDKKFVHFEEKMDKQFARIEERIDRKFCWNIGIQITSLLATMAFIAQMTRQG